MAPEPHDPWGATTREIFAVLDRIHGSDQQVALATVVGVNGSAYRRPGAKMVLDADGTVSGGITAGCLEGPLQDIAKGVVEAGTPALETFDLTSDENTWGLGLGCEGVVDVLVEPVDESWLVPVERYRDGLATVVVTVIDAPEAALIGSRGFFDEGATEIETDAPSGRPDHLVAVMQQCASEAGNDQSPHRTAGPADDIECFVDVIEPATPVLFFGGQPDLRPVTRVARQVGMDVTVATPRAGTAADDAFPNADRVVSCHPAEIAEFVDNRTHVVIMSHNFIDDRLALEALLDTAVPYIGIMGPRDRFDRMRAELEEAGQSLQTSDRERIATPVGLDLGGGEPIEIAMSIVAEVLAVSNGREGGRLRDGDGPIHERNDPPNAD